jgi:hypothetical protein
MAGFIVERLDYSAAAKSTDMPAKVRQGSRRDICARAQQRRHERHEEPELRDDESVHDRREQFRILPGMDQGLLTSTVRPLCPEMCPRGPGLGPPEANAGLDDQDKPPGKFKCH